ncbi:MAG: IS21 family transposase [Peptococcaceae bacterium]|nr:IS21 family transposase [Peptococcaceae bacterium]
MTNYREILRLESLGINHSQIALSVGCSRQTVISVLKKAKQKSLSYQTIQGFSDRELMEAIQDGALKQVPYRMPDYEKIHRELMRSGVTLSLLWIEYCEECRRSGDLPYQSTQFNKYYADYARKTKATMHIERKPAESAEVDWCGSKMSVINSETGEPKDAYVFVSALSYSGYSYVEAFWSMETENWIQAHVKAFTFYGGVPRWIIPDNLKTGITRNTRTETVINKTYQEMAEHYGTAIIPARVEAPNDKPHAEGSVKITQTWIMAALRDCKFFTLAELNKAIHEKLVTFNNHEFQIKQGSRKSWYLEEKPFLLPLPKYPFEVAEWKQATVQRNYHVRCGNQYFSTPYEYIGKKVDIRMTSRMVEILYEGIRICSHPRTEGYFGKYVTQEAHMPPNHQQYGAWSGEGFRRWAKKIGLSCSKVVEYFLSTAKLEQQAYKTCNALLQLSNRYSGVRLEAACERVLQFTPRPSYKAVSAILKAKQDTWGDNHSSKSSLNMPEYGFIRGAEYYGGGDPDVE